MNYQFIYSLRIAKELSKRGFKMIDMRPNYKNPRYMVYIFENSAELQNILHELSVK